MMRVLLPMLTSTCHPVLSSTPGIHLPRTACQRRRGRPAKLGKWVSDVRAQNHQVQVFSPIAMASSCVKVSTWGSAQATVNVHGTWVHINAHAACDLTMELGRCTSVLNHMLHRGRAKALVRTARTRVARTKAARVKEARTKVGANEMRLIATSPMMILRACRIQE